jgi:hypothetical protein
MAHTPCLAAGRVACSPVGELTEDSCSTRLEFATGAFSISRAGTPGDDVKYKLLCDQHIFFTSS